MAGAMMSDFQVSLLWGIAASALFSGRGWPAYHEYPQAALSRGAHREELRAPTKNLGILKVDPPAPVQPSDNAVPASISTATSGKTKLNKRAWTTRPSCSHTPDPQKLFHRTCKAGGCLAPGDHSCVALSPSKLIWCQVPTESALICLPRARKENWTTTFNKEPRTCPMDEMAAHLLIKEEIQKSN